MKHLLRKAFLIIALIMISTVVVAKEARSLVVYDSTFQFEGEIRGVGDAPNIFSHTVLKLPYDLRSEEPWSRIIRTKEEWELFYNELLEDNLGEGNTAGHAIPEIDFETFQVVTGGLGRTDVRYKYKVSVGKVGSDNLLSSIMNIEVIVVSFEGCDLVAGLRTYPSSTILIKKTNKPIRFFALRTIGECPNDIFH